jgi:hypothetical protein
MREDGDNIRRIAAWLNLQSTDPAGRIRILEAIGQSWPARVLACMNVGRILLPELL